MKETKNWQTLLISIYVLVDELVNRDSIDHLRWRFCKSNKKPKFTDEEVLTVYFFGLLSGLKEKKKIHEYANNHLLEWFPELVSYETYVDRLNKLDDLMVGITGELRDQLLIDCSEPDNIRLLDSMPIILAKEKRRYTAKVAPELADVGYCASKNEKFYGVKLHIVGRKIEGTLPLPEFIGLTNGSIHDLKGGEAIANQIQGGSLFDDRAYYFGDEFNEILDSNGTLHFAVKKKKKNQKYLEIYDEVRNSDISRIRQPIESLFNWICEKVDIQKGSKIRSMSGLMIHVFGRLSAALIGMLFF